MNIWIAIATGAATIAAALVYGIFAGRHDAPPAPAVISLKNRIERIITPAHHFRRAFNSDTSAALPATCPPDNPIVILTGGQSNAGNALSDPVDADPSVPAFMFFAGRCWHLADPLLGPTGDKGSLWTPLGQRLARESNRPVVLVNGAVGATTFADWLDPRSGYLARLESLGEEAARAGFRPHLVLWHQGEADALSGATADVYARHLGMLTDHLLERLPIASGARLILFGVSRCHGPARQTPNAALAEARRRVIDAAPRILAGPDTDRYDNRFRHDGCHFNARGRDAIVTDTLALIRPLLDAR